MYRMCQERNSTWQIRFWRLMGVKRNNEQGIFLMCSKEEDWKWILRCAEKQIRMDDILDKRFRNTEAEISIQRTARCKNIKQWQNIAIEWNRHKFRWLKNGRHSNRICKIKMLMDNSCVIYHRKSNLSGMMEHATRESNSRTSSINCNRHNEIFKR